MNSDNDQVFGNSIESSEEKTDLKIKENGKEAGCELFYYTRSNEWDKENNGNMSGHSSSEFKFDPKNVEIKKNHDNLKDPPVLYMDKNVMACELLEIVISNKELTYNVVKDICVDEGVPMMQKKFLLYHKAGCENSSPRDAIATSGSVSKEALTLGDIISMEDSQKPLNSNNNNNNINGPEENVETKQEKTEEPKSDNFQYLSSEMPEPENQRQNIVLEDSYDHNLFSSNFPNGLGESSFSEAESGLAHITHSEPISVSGSLSVCSDGSTVSAHSFAFPILESEWNSSPVRMVKAEKKHLRKEKGWRHYSFLLCCRF